MSFKFRTSLNPFTSIFFASPEHHDRLAVKCRLHGSASTSTFSPPPTRHLSPDFTPKQLLRTLRLQNEETSALRILEWASKQPKFVPISSLYEEILRKLGKVGSFESMLLVLEEMKLAGSEVRRGTFLILVESYARFEFYDEILGVVELMEVGFGLKPDRRFYNYLLKVLVDGNEFKLVETGYFSMVREGIKPDALTFRIVIKGLCRAHQIRSAILMMEEMLSYGLSPEKRTIRMLMQSCVEEGYLDGTLRIREKLWEAGCRWNLMAVNGLVGRFFKAGRVVEALNLLKSEGLCEAGYVRHVNEVMGRGRLQEYFDPGIFTCKSLVSRLHDLGEVPISALGKPNPIEEATKLVDVLTSKSIIMHDVFALNSLIHGFCTKGNHGAAMELFEEMKSKGCRPDVCTYNMLIDSLCSMQRFEESMSMLNEMDTNGCPRSVVTYNILIKGFCKNKCVEEAEVIFKQMELQGVSRNTVTYNTLIDGLCKSMRIKDAMHLMGQMAKEGLKPNEFTYNSLLTHFCGTGNIKKAAGVVQAMASDGCEPDIVTYNTLIRGLCKAGSRAEFEVAIRILKTFETKGMILSPHAYNPVIHELFRRKRRTEGMKLFREMMEKEDPPNAITYNIVFGGLCNAGGSMHDAIDFAFEMMEKGLIPEFSSFTSLAEGLCTLSMEKTLAKLVATLMEKANLSNSEVSTIKGFFHVRKFRDGLLALGNILKRYRNTNGAN